MSVECKQHTASLDHSHQKSVRPNQLFQDKRGMLYTWVRFQIPPTTGGTTRHDITLYLWHDLTCCYYEYESRRRKIHAQAVSILLESWHGGRYPSRLSWNSTVPTDNSRCNYINQVADCNLINVVKQKTMPALYIFSTSLYVPTYCNLYD